jgi:hypothetical protein
MSNYKLIKKLPFENSPEIGYISKPTREKDNVHYWNHNWFQPKDYPEYWEKVKEWEILSVYYEGTKAVYDWNGSFFQNKRFGLIKMTSALEGSLGEKGVGYDINIQSIKRTSDGEVFSIGDLVKNNKVKATIEGFIKKFEIDEEGNLLVHYNGFDELGDIDKIEQPILTTEDGVDIYEGDAVFETIDNDKVFEVSFTKNSIMTGKNSRKYFSTEEKAEEYILMNKPLTTSIKELCVIIGQCNETTHIDLDLLTEKLKKLVK